MKLSKCIHKFLIYLEVEKNKSQKTIENYQHYLSRLLNFFGDCSVKTIKLEQIQDYRLYLNRQKFGVQLKELSKKTQNYHVIAVRALLKYLTKNDIDCLAPEKIELMNTVKRTVDFLEPTEINKLLETFSGSKIIDKRNKAICELLFATGLRISELRA